MALGAILFIGMAWLIPHLYFQYILSDDSIMKVTRFEPEDVFVGDTQQLVLLERDVSHTFVADVVRELNMVLIDAKTGEPTGDIRSVKTDNAGKVLYESSSLPMSVQVVYPLPNDLRPGEYYWLLYVRIDFKKDVVRELTFKSDPFIVYNKVEVEQDGLDGSTRST